LAFHYTIYFALSIHKPNRPAIAPKLLTPEELYSEAQEANQKLEEACLIATQEKTRADRLAEKLRQLGVDLE
jgi:hypothetical protein